MEYEILTNKTTYFAYGVKELRETLKSIDDEVVKIWKNIKHNGTNVDVTKKYIIKEANKMVDFRTVKETVNRVVAELKENDANWSWRAVVNKSEIKVYWGYLQYVDKKDSHFTIKMSDRLEESNTDDFMVARNEHDEYMEGAIVGDDCGCDGDVGRCVTVLLKAIASIAHSRY